MTALRIIRQGSAVYSLCAPIPRCQRLYASIAPVRTLADDHSRQGHAASLTASSGPQLAGWRGGSEGRTATNAAQSAACG